jgi:hypothetical protein
VSAVIIAATENLFFKKEIPRTMHLLSKYNTMIPPSIYSIGITATPKPDFSLA